MITSLTRRSVWIAAVALFAASSAQLPPDQKLSGEDAKGFAREIDRLQILLASANDKGAVEFQIAKTYAWGGQYKEAMDWLQRVVDEGLGFDPARDQAFAALRSTGEFQTLESKVQSQTTRVANSHLFAKIAEADLLPENLAYDVSTSTFLLGSTVRGAIARCTRQGTCAPFVVPHREGLGSVLGLKIDRRSKTLWATSNEGNGASLRQYSLTSGNPVKFIELPGRHIFNDLVVTSQTEVFVTDTKEGSVYKLSSAKDALKRFLPEHEFVAANGIAISPDEKTLFVASFGDGITAIDLASQSAKPLRHPSDVCLAYIDGLYAVEGSLIAIQNGPMTPRIVRFVLSSDNTSIVSMKILERKNPLFDGVTTGVLNGNQFYYMANAQLDQAEGGKLKPDAKLSPLQILILPVGNSGR